MRSCKKKEIEEMKKMGIWTKWDSVINQSHYIGILFVILTSWFIFDFELQDKVIEYLLSLFSL